MRNFKKFLTLVLAVLMVVSVFAANVSAAKFTDVDEDNEYLNKAVNLLSYLNVTKGTSETTFGTDELVTREQMAAFIYRLVKKGQSIEGGANTSPFTDLEDPTFFFMISWASSQGIIKGTSATTFEPKGSITLQDAYVMLVRALGYEKEEALPYPFGYIEIAEQKDVELNEGLDSSVGYTTALTRGDVAILLYNTFFAETGVPETTQKERLLGKGTDAATYVLETVTEYPIFCEKYFDVEEIEYQAIATPHYAFGDEKDTTSSLGYDAVYLKAVEKDSNSKAPEEFYADAKDLAIDGSADNYIMSHFKMYITLDKDDKVDTILYAEPLMVKKTVNNIKLDTLTTNTKASYYGNDAKNAKRLSGKAIVDGSAVYFYNAPYSYAKPSYTTDANDQSRYELRNEKNVKFISRAAIDVDDEEFKYELDADIFDTTYDDSDVYEDNSEILANKLAQVYAGGLYEATFYDVDGDDLYDYIEYLPYSFAIVDDDDDKTFVDDGFDKETIFTNEAITEGEKFKNEDFIIGYFNQDLNYIKVAYVVAPIKGAVKAISGSTITLSDGTKVATDEGWKAVANYDAAALLAANGYDVESANDDFTEFKNLLTASALGAKDAEFYVYNGAVLYTEGVKNNVTLDKNVVILTQDPDETGFYQTGNFDRTTGKRPYYFYAWIDGELKYINVDTDTESTGIWPKVTENNGATYADKIATYEADANGLYTIKLAGNAYEDEDMGANDYIGLAKDTADFDDKDDTLQALIELDGDYYLVKSMSRRFILATTAEGKNVLDYQLVLTADTKVVIKNYDSEDDEYEWLEYDYNSLTDTAEAPISNVQFVIQNNVDYTTRENLVFLFAEATDFDLKTVKTNKSDRIVKNIEPTLNSDNRIVYSYTVFNPYTGSSETALGSKDYSSSSAASKFGYGDIVTMATSGKIDESKNAKDNIIRPDDTVSIGGKDYTKGFYWVLDYDPTDDVIILGNVGSEEELLTVDVSDANVVSIGGQGQSLGDGMIKWGSIAAVAKSKLGSDDKALLTVKKDYVKPSDKSGKLTTVYAKYQKVYVEMEEASSKSDYDADAEYVAIILHDGEEEANCDLK